jgi:hypothetical protein
MLRGQVRKIFPIPSSPTTSPRPGDRHRGSSAALTDGHVTIEDNEKFLRNYMQELHAFIVRVR